MDAGCDHGHLVTFPRRLVTSLGQSCDRRSHGINLRVSGHRTKYRTRMHWQPVRTSDKLTGQLMRLSFKFTRDYAHEFDILAETGMENFDRSLRDGLDLELYQPVYEMPFFDQ